jgi:ectoine hydroxylase-related dioxygenase (phytanoyl-CoA dioxygenase family)
MIDFGHVRLDFQNFGVAIVRQVLSDETKSTIKAGVAKLRDGIASGAIARTARFVDGSNAYPDEIYALYKDPALIQIAAMLLGTSNICLYMNRILMKDDGWDGDVAIHQDAPYFSGSLEKVTIFVPLVPTGRARGGLIFVKGSHKYGGMPRGAIRREVFAPMEDFAPELELGDVIPMNHLTWHYSERSTEPTERPLLQIIYQSAADGSYATKTHGVAEPTLICGSWQTRHFAPLIGSVTPDA